MLQNCLSCFGILGGSAIKIGLSESTICNLEQGANGLRSQCLGEGGDDNVVSDNVAIAIGLSASTTCDLEQSKSTKTS